MPTLMATIGVLYLRDFQEQACLSTSTKAQYFGALGATTEASRSTVKDAELQELRRVFFDMFLLFVQLLRAAMLLLLSRPDFQSFFVFFVFVFCAHAEDLQL